MKRQILIFSVTIASIVLFSCSKQMPEVKENAGTEEIATAASAQKPAGTERPDLSKNLEAWFAFNGNLSDQTDQLFAISSYPSGAGIYTTDRKGFANKALKFNGRYILSIPSVPHSPAMSVAAWVKYDSASGLLGNFVHTNSDGPKFMQSFNQHVAFNNSLGNPNIASGPLDNQWHHLVATIDGTNLKFYVDGIMVGTVSSPDTDGQTSQTYYIGSGATPYREWEGAIDELRFYSRTLSAQDVQALFKAK